MTSVADLVSLLGAARNDSRSLSFARTATKIVIAELPHSQTTTMVQALLVCEELLDAVGAAACVPTIVLALALADSAGARHAATPGRAP